MKSFSDYPVQQLDDYFNTIQSNVNNSRNVFFDPNGGLRNAPLDEGLVFHFVANKDLIQFDAARKIGDNFVPVMEMVDADENAISVSHLIRNRNGLKHLYENTNGTRTTARQALKNLVNKIIAAGQTGITIKVKNVSRYPSNHLTRADQVRMIVFEQQQG